MPYSGLSSALNTSPTTSGVTVAGTSRSPSAIRLNQSSRHNRSATPRPRTNSIVDRAEGEHEGVDHRAARGRVAPQGEIIVEPDEMARPGPDQVVTVERVEKPLDHRPDRDRQHIDEAPAPRARPGTAGACGRKEQPVDGVSGGVIRRCRRAVPRDDAHPDGRASAARVCLAPSARRRVRAPRALQARRPDVI